MKKVSLTFCLILATYNVFAASCSTAPLDEPCKPDAGGKTRRAKKDILGLIVDAQEMDLAVQKSRAKFLAVKDDPGVSLALRFAACETYRAKKMEQDRLYKHAMDETEALYHVGPRTRDAITTAPPRDPTDAWLGGLSAQWAPQTTESGAGVNLAYRIHGSDRRDHYGGKTNVDPRDIKKGVSGITLPDGRTFIPKGMFDIALERGNPGVLAYVLYHEARHFNRLSSGWASLNEEEVVAYANAARFARMFGLSKTDIDELNGLAERHYAAVKAGQTGPLTPTAKVEAAWKDNYERTHLDLEKEYADLKTEVDAARHEQELRQRESEAAERAREAEATVERRRLEEIARTIAQADDEIRRCGFEPLHDRDGRVNGFKGYTHRYGPAVMDNYDFENAMTLDQLKASLLLARACNGAVNRGQVEAPCNNGLDILNQHAVAGYFRDGLSAREGSDGNLNLCFNHLRRDLAAPTDFRDLQRLVDPIIQQQEAWYKKYRLQAEREAKSNAEAERKRKARGERQQNSGSGGNDNGNDCSRQSPSKGWGSGGYCR